MPELYQLALNAMNKARRQIGQSSVKSYRGTADFSQMYSQKYSEELPPQRIEELAQKKAAKYLPTRVESVKHQRRNLRGYQRHLRFTEQELLAYANQVLLEGIGDGLEYAAVIYKDLNYRLSTTGVPLDVVGVNGHAFVVINCPLMPAFSYSNPYEVWPSTALIVDGFTRILCPANLYGKEWRMKMEIWEARKMLLDGDSPTARGRLRKVTTNYRIRRSLIIRPWTGVAR